MWMAKIIRTIGRDLKKNFRTIIHHAFVLITVWLLLTHNSGLTSTPIGATGSASGSRTTTTSTVETSRTASIILEPRWQDVDRHPCCEALIQRREVGGQDPDNCLVEGTSCKFTQVYVPAPSPPEGSHGLACVDGEGRARSSAAADSQFIFSAGTGLPPCVEGDPSAPKAGWWWWLRAGGRMWWWWWWAVTGVVLFGRSALALIYTARLPLRYGSEGHRVFETMSYKRRLLANSTLWVLNGGGPLFFMWLEGVMLHSIIASPSLLRVITMVAVFVAITYVGCKPLPYIFPRKNVVNSWFFKLWREFFDVRYVTEFGAPTILLHEGNSHVIERKSEDDVMETRNKNQKDDSNADKETSMLAQRENSVREARSQKKEDNSNEDKETNMLAQSENNVMETMSQHKEDDTNKDKKTYMLAQVPHGVIPYGAILGASMLNELLPEVEPVSAVVASIMFYVPVLRQLMNCLGAREASSRMIHQMFADAYQAVGVVSGGMAEMFVSKDTERLISPRKNFGKCALQGGHDIVPIFGFGVSRTLDIFPGFNNGLTIWFSRKLRFPFAPYRGPFVLDFMPYRQQLKLVVGRPIEVTKATEEVTDEQAQAVCDKVEEAIVDLYERHRPFWEKRPVCFEK